MDTEKAHCENATTQIETNSISNEEMNYLRIINLLIRVATPVVRLKFNQELNPGSLEDTLKKAWVKLRNDKVVSQKQMQILYPNTGMVSSNNFDLTLMILLIKKLTDIEIGENLPHLSLNNVGAHLSTIKYYRNQAAHSDGILEDDDFEIWWNNISKAINELSDGKCKQKCMDLKICKIDNSDKDLFTAILNLEHQHNPIPIGAQGLFAQEILIWENEKVVQTKGIEHLKQLLEKKNVVYVIGVSGCGKSTAVHYAALHLNTKYGFEIVPSVFIGDIRHYYNDKSKQVFVFDDPFGKYAVDVRHVSDWKAISKYIEMILAKDKSKILLSCRSYIFHQLDISVKGNTLCDLTLNDYSLSTKEKIQIARIHLNEQDSQILENEDNLTDYDFFPLLCKLFSSSELDIKSFFTKPVDAIKDELTQMMYEDKTAFATLVLFVLFNNSVPDNISLKNQNLKSIMIEIAEELDSPYIFSLSKQLTKLKQNYIKISDDQFSLIHDKLFDILVSFCGEHLYDITVNYSNNDIIRERFQFESLMNDSDDCIIKVPEEKEDSYFLRLFRNIDDGRVIFENRQMKFQLFCTKLLHHLQQNKDILEVVFALLEGTHSPLLSVARHGSLELLEFFTVNSMLVDVVDDVGRTPLYLAAQYGHLSCVKFLLNMGVILTFL